MLGLGCCGTVQYSRICFNPYWPFRSHRQNKLTDSEKKKKLLLKFKFVDPIRNYIACTDRSYADTVASFNAMATNRPDITLLPGHPLNVAPPPQHFNNFAFVPYNNPEPKRCQRCGYYDHLMITCTRPYSPRGESLCLLPNVP